jgi:uncharacterized membrane protein
LPKARLEALTDGIFAVTMTLLVLDLTFPEATADATFYDDLMRLVDRLDNYVISFVVLGLFWVGHLRLVRRLREADGMFAAQNLAFLLFTTLVPPLTSLLGDHPESPRAAVLYGGNLLLILGAEMLMWHRACTRLADEPLPDARATWVLVRQRYMLSMGVVVAGIAAALVEIVIGRSAGLAPWLYLLLIAAGIVRRPGHGELAPGHRE